MKFWSNKPLSVSNNDTSKLLINTPSLLEAIKKELQNCSIQLDYTCIPFHSVNNYTDILNFINKTYDYDDSNFKLHYSEDLIKYFLKENGVLCCFYPKGTTTLIGLICGSSKDLVVRKQVFKSVEVNFLCLVKQLRNLHVSSYMINVLTKTCIELFNVQCAFYTIGKQVDPKYFCSKSYYHIPINVHKLNMIDFIKTHYYPEFKQANLKLELIENINDKQIHSLYTKLDEFYENKFDIYHKLSYSDFKSTFNNKAFVHFKDSSNKNYICLYCLDTVNKDKQCTASNGYLYLYFTDNLFTLLESVAYTCQNNDIFDMITLLHDPYLKNKLLLKGTSTLYYYAYNLQLPGIETKRNGLVTI